MKNIKLVFITTLIIFPLQLLYSQHQIPYKTISSGGMKTSSSAHSITFTIGESVIGKCSNTVHSGAMGFWSLYQADILTSVEEEETLPVEYKLEQNYPNPFNPVTNIKYSVPERAVVTIKIYNIAGEEITTLVNEEKDRGWYEVKFGVNDLSSGIYLCRMQAGSYVNIKKMMLLK